MMPFEWVVGDSSKDHTVTAPTSTTRPATAGYTTLWGTTALASNTSDLDEVHQAYALAFRGESWSRLLKAGAAWHESVAASLYQAPVVDALASHLERGNEVVFVSGSWAPCLEPIADYLGVRTVIQSVPRLDDDGDTLSGSFEIMMLGSRKSAAVQAHAAQIGADLDSAYAYADHPSDEPFLRAVGHPTVVGEDRYLRELATANGWSALPRTLRS